MQLSGDEEWSEGGTGALGSGTGRTLLRAGRQGVEATVEGQDLAGSQLYSQAAWAA